MIRVLASLLLLACCGGASAVYDSWYELKLGGVRAGWAHGTEHIQGDLRTVSSTESMRIARGPSEVSVTATTVWVDHLDGTPVSMHWTQDMGGVPVETTWTFQPGEVVIEVAQGGRVSTATQPTPRIGWLTPAASLEVLRRKASAGADEVQFHTLMPDLGLTPVKQTMRRIGQGVLESPRGVIEVSTWSVSIEGLPVELETWFSPDFHPVKTIMNAPFGVLESTLTDRATARGASGGPAPELFTSLFVRPTGEAESLATARRVFLRLTTQDGSPLELPASGAQTIAGERDTGVLLLVEREASMIPAAGGVAPACAESSAMINASDAQVESFARSAIAGLPADASPGTRAEALRRAVRAWITDKGLETAFASASETVRNRVGDCSEHGVLLAAALRAIGIPSRVASGLVWMDGVDAFGWHMWTQAFIDGQWIDLDATLPTPFSAGHVLVATSTLKDGDGQRQLMSMLGLLGNLDIEVVRVDR
ncbi:MAG: transglutaminase-like domain-containing protein [Phycisphaerales bacterium]|nr:transglutaminase-like domain-containing protein [Phycisphaerales bacterium]